MRRLAAGIAASVVLGLATAAALAQDAPMSVTGSVATNTSDGTPGDNPSPADSSSAYPLNQKGNWDLSVWITEAVGNSAYGDVGDAYVSMAGFRTGYVFARPVMNGPMRGTLEYFFDVIPVLVLTKPQVIYNAGVSPVGLRWNFAASRRQPFLEVSLGGTLSNRDVPPGNTSKLNFTVSSGGGVTILQRERTALTANVGFWHLSNAHMGQTNPSLNALTFGIAYHWFKAK